MLFKAKYFDNFRRGVVSNLDTFSRNSALSVLAIWDCVHSRFYDIDFGGLIESLRKGLPSESSLVAIPFNISDGVLSSLSDKRYRLLSAHFYHYFFVRLPILFQWNRLIHRGRKRHLDRTEMDAVIRSCVASYAETYGDTGVALSPDEFRRFAGLARWYIRRRVQEDQVYSIQWLWDALAVTHPDIMTPSNIGSITNHIVESCFPMFWDTLQERYRDSMVCYANFGWFVGDADIDEIEAALRSSAEKDIRG